MTNRQTKAKILIETIFNNIELTILSILRNIAFVKIKKDLKYKKEDKGEQTYGKWEQKKNII